MTLSSFRLQRRPRAVVGDAPGQAGRELLRFPLPIAVRIAVMEGNGTGFAPAANMRVFAGDDMHGLLDYAPEALVLPLGLALAWADQKLRGLLDLPSLTCAVVGITSPHDGPMAPHHRDLLWKAFGLPVFEQLRGRDGRIIARECEVHDGLHFDETAAAECHNSGEIVAGQCECGIDTPRLRHRVRERSRAAAA